MANIFDTLEKNWNKCEINKDGFQDWTECTEKDFYYGLEVLPPAKQSGMTFVMGECWKMDDKGRIFTVFIEVDGRYFARMDYIHSFNPLAYKWEVCKQFSIAKDMTTEYMEVAK